jgi:L-ornithine Nalpha-acyltransferase
MAVKALHQGLSEIWPDVEIDSITKSGRSFGKKGSMEVRFAQSRKEVEACQKIRFEVFYEEMSALADETAINQRIDADVYDPICDHLLVIDYEPADKTQGVALPTREGNVVGTYRLLRQEIAEAHNGFYSADEFDIASLLQRKSSEYRFLELGRSCVLKSYRTKPTVELLWQGIWNYLQLFKFDAMFGCASLEGTDPDALSLPLSYLHHHYQAPEDWRVKALPERYVEMNRQPAETINEREAMRALPPLIKGYLRLGAYIGDGAVVDHQFNTTDVLIVMPVSAISERYAAHFGGQDARVS